MKVQSSLKLFSFLSLIACSMLVIFCMYVLVANEENLQNNRKEFFIEEVQTFFCSYIQCEMRFESM